MEKTLLIAGKEVPEGIDFASGAALKGRNVVVTANPPEKEGVVPSSENGYTPVVWNRSSPISARSLVLACKNQFNSLDEAVLYFDEPLYAARSCRLTAEDCAYKLDEMTAGYQYLALEILSRFEQEKRGAAGIKPGKLVFLHKTNPSQRDAARSSSVRTQTEALSSPFVAAAGAAFDAFAENLAALCAQRDDTLVLLVSFAAANETALRDNTLSSWLCGYLDAVDELKSKPVAKEAVSWIKAGAKGPGGFSLFK